jgi:hypothetical protein
MRSTLFEWAIRVGISATLAVSGVIHAYLFIHGYRHIPTVGPAFLLQASVFCALALLILVGAPAWFSWAGAALSIGTLIAFALSRTVGLFGFSERGLQPSPEAAVSLITEVLTVVFVAVYVLERSRRTTVPATP